VQEIRKIDMAVQQLEDALQAYFNGRYHSALVLAAAAEQLFAGYMHLHKIEPAFSSMRKVIVKIANGLKSSSGTPFKPTTEKDIGELLNRAYNHSHHAGKTELELHMNPRFEAQETIDRAVSNFDSLLVKYDLAELPLAQRFVMESLDEAKIKIDVEEVLSPVATSSEA
jgi:hypothetical protein